MIAAAPHQAHKMSSFLQRQAKTKAYQRGRITTTYQPSKSANMKNVHGFLLVDVTMMFLAIVSAGSTPSLAERQQSRRGVVLKGQAGQRGEPGLVSLRRRRTGAVNRSRARCSCCRETAGACLLMISISSESIHNLLCRPPPLTCCPRLM